MVSDFKRVRKLVLHDQAVDRKDLETARRFVNNASRFSRTRIGLVIVLSALLLAEIVWGIASGHWIWGGGLLITTLFLILGQAIGIRDQLRAQRWAAHHLDMS